MIKNPVQGTPSLCVCGIRWKDMNRYLKDSECVSLGNQIKSFYQRNSRQLLKFDIEGHSVKVPYNAAKKNINKAENYCKDQYPKKDYYSICNMITGSNAGGNTAHLKGDLVRTACHENGHLLGLGHAGKYIFSKGGKVSLDPYGDSLSVMSKFASNTLSAPQYWFLGWLYKEEGIDHDYTTTKTYSICNVTDFNSKSTLKVIRVKLPNNERDAYISYPKLYKGNPQIALHFGANGGAGSQLIHLSTKTISDTKFTNLNITINSYKNGIVNITISPITPQLRALFTPIYECTDCGSEIDNLDDLVPYDYQTDIINDVDDDEEVDDE